MRLHHKGKIQYIIIMTKALVYIRDVLTQIFIYRRR